jgi:hypothetical protein
MHPEMRVRMMERAIKLIPGVISTAANPKADPQSSEESVSLATIRISRKGQ